MNIYVNGTRVVARGGNWGLSDQNMGNTAADYDLKMRLHRDENLNIVRNWVGMTGSPAFYDAADKYGIMIMDDFWLANPFDPSQGYLDEETDKPYDPWEDGSA